MTSIRAVRHRLLAAVLAAGVLTAACQKAAPTADAPKVVSPDAWAVVDGHEITKAVVDKAYRSSVDPNATPPPTDDQILTVKLNIVDEMITQELLLARAHAVGAEATDAEIQTAIGQRRGGMTDEVFQQQLKQRGLTLDDFKEGVRREVTAQNVLDKETSAKSAVTEQEIAAFYEKNRAQFNVTEPQVRLAQIVVAPGRDPQVRNRMNDDAETPDDVARKIAMLEEKLKAGVDFGSLAMDYSEDPQSAAQGGDLGFMPTSALSKVAPQLREAVLKMQPGNVRAVGMGSGYTIIAMIAREPAGQRDLKTPTVHDGIRDMLQSHRQEMLRAAYIADARAGASVTNTLARQALAAHVAAPAALAPAAPR